MSSPEAQAELIQQAKFIQIEDTAVNQTAIRQRVAQALASRKPGQDVAQIGPESLRPGNTAVPLASSETLNRLMIGLMGQEPLHEKPFTSNLPVFGPLIVAMRRAWNWMSTRWYVLPIIQQQNETNRKLLLVINELTQWQELDARRISQLEARLNQMKSSSASPTHINEKQ